MRASVTTPVSHSVSVCVSEGGYVMLGSFEMDSSWACLIIMSGTSVLSDPSFFSLPALLVFPTKAKPHGHLRI